MSPPEQNKNKNRTLNMSTTRTLLLGAVAAAALTTLNLQAADFSPSDLSNRAIAASPRAKEQFPWLTRQPSPVVSPSRVAVVAAIKKNRALAASPRMIEQFPELARSARPASAAAAKSGTGESQLARVMKNHSLAASPRMLEQFPQLARGYKSEPAKQSIEVAPLK